MENEEQETSEELGTSERRRGRPPGTRRPTSMVKATIMLEPEAVEWAKTQTEGLSGMLRRLLAAEHEKAKGKQK